MAEDNQYLEKIRQVYLEQTERVGDPIMALMMLILSSQIDDETISQLEADQGKVAAANAIAHEVVNLEGSLISLLQLSF